MRANEFGYQTGNEFSGFPAVNRVPELVWIVRGFHSAAATLGRTPLSGCSKTGRVGRVSRLETSGAQLKA